MPTARQILADVIGMNPEDRTTLLYGAAGLVTLAIGIPVACFVVGAVWSVVSTGLCLGGAYLLGKGLWRFFGLGAPPTPASLSADARAAGRDLVPSSALVDGLLRAGEIAGLGGLAAWALASVLGVPTGLVLSVAALLALTGVLAGTYATSPQQVWHGVQRAAGGAAAVAALVFPATGASAAPPTTGAAALVAPAAAGTVAPSAPAPAALVPPVVVPVPPLPAAAPGPTASEPATSEPGLAPHVVTHASAVADSLGIAGALEAGTHRD